MVHVSCSGSAPRQQRLTRGAAWGKEQWPGRAGQKGTTWRISLHNTWNIYEVSFSLLFLDMLYKLIVNWIISNTENSITRWMILLFNALLLDLTHFPHCMLPFHLLLLSPFQHSSSTRYNCHLSKNSFLPTIIDTFLTLPFHLLLPSPFLYSPWVPWP